MSGRKAGVSHAKNIMAMRASKDPDEVQHFKDCYEAFEAGNGAIEKQKAQEHM